MMRFITVFSLALAACASAPAAQNATQNTAPQPPQSNQQEQTQAQVFEHWQADFSARAIAKGYGSDLVRSVIGNAKINPRALESDSTQPEFTKPVWSYVDGVRSPARLKSGQAKLTKHATLFAAIQSRYQVDSYILTSIWGLESNYGNNIGTQDIIDNLATFAFEGRRQEFGEEQLFAVLDMLKNGQVRKNQLKGSWAGAMGMTQFIPTTFRDYAVDFDGDGNQDLWKNEGDALASAAHYLSRHGWRFQEPILAEVLLPDGFDYALTDGSKRTVASWAALDVHPVGGQNWSTNAQLLDAKLLTLAGHKGPAFLIFKNFDVIKRYNNSTSYALGIAILAESFQGRGQIVRDWPRADKILSLSDKKSLQETLTEQGFDTQGVDGRIGPNTRKAIRAWQKANGLPQDGYVEQNLFAQIIAQ